MDEFSDFLGVVRAYMDANKELHVDKSSVVNGVLDIEGKDVRFGMDETEEEVGHEGKNNMFLMEEGNLKRGKVGNIITVYKRQRRKLSGDRYCSIGRLSKDDDVAKQSEGLNEKGVNLHKEIKEESLEQMNGEGERVISKKKIKVDMNVENDVERDGSGALSQSYFREYWSNKNNPDKMKFPDVGTSSMKEDGTRGGSKKEKRDKKKGKKRKIVKTGNDKNKVFPSRSDQKKHMRMKIMDMLLVAGWRIEYRPRGGKQYNDAVYISPEGRGFWSVTLAYKIFKEHHEAMGHSGSVFTPIPEEELKILERITKKRKEREMGLNDIGNSKENKKRVQRLKKRQMDKNKHKKKVKIRKLKRSRDQKKKKFEIEGDELQKLRGRPRKILDNSTDMPIKEPNKSLMKKRSSHQNRRRCSLIARTSNEGSGIQNYIHYPGKRCVLAWMIEMGSVPLNGKVQCMNKKSQVMFHGVIMDDGICCDCCNQEFSLTSFAIHAESEAIPASQNIYLESGESLLQCQLDSWKKQNEAGVNGFSYIDLNIDDPNDDTCNRCGDGGDLVCCDSCPSTFHQSCLGMQEFPSGAWHCIYCSCKFCGVMCGSFSETNTNNDTRSTELLICSLCEEKYHLLCSPLNNLEFDESCNPLFCSSDCKMIYENLQKLFGVKHELEDGFSWTIIQQSDVDFDSCLTETPQKVESNAKIAVALSLMDECFLPIIDERSGINLIHNIVYNLGSNFNRLNFTGFVTIILERDDELVSAASVRIHGARLTEMPFIGTRHIFRRKGFCRRLLHVVENALTSLGINKLVIPAVHELLDTWTNVFGFEPLDTTVQEQMKHMNMLVFPCTDMLQKSLVKNSFFEDKMILSADTGVVEAECSEAVLDSKVDVVLNTLKDSNGSICGNSKSDSINVSTDKLSPILNLSDDQFDEGMVLQNDTEVPNFKGKYQAVELFDCKEANLGKDRCHSTEDNNLLNQSTILFTGLSECTNVASRDPDKNNCVGGDDLTLHDEEMNACGTNVSEFINTLKTPETVSPYTSNENHVGIGNFTSNVDSVSEIARLPTVDMDIIEIGSVYDMDEGCFCEEHGKVHEEVTDLCTNESTDEGKVCFPKTGDQLHVATIGVKIFANDAKYSSSSVEEATGGGSHESATAPFVLEPSVDMIMACSEENDAPNPKSTSLLNNIVIHPETVVPPESKADVLEEDHEVGRYHIMEISVSEGTSAFPDCCSDKNISPVCPSTSGLNGLSDDVEIVLQTIGEADNVGDHVRGTQHIVSDPSTFSEEIKVQHSEEKHGYGNDHKEDNTPSTVGICNLDEMVAGWVSSSEGNSDRIYTSTSDLNGPCCTEIGLCSLGGKDRYGYGKEGSTVHNVRSSCYSKGIPGNMVCCSGENTDRFCGVTSNFVSGSREVETEICDVYKKEGLVVNNDLFCGTTSGFDGGQPCDLNTTVPEKHSMDFYSEDKEETTGIQVIELCSSSEVTDVEQNFSPVESDEDNIGTAIPLVIEVCTSEERSEGFYCSVEDNNGHLFGETSKFNEDCIGQIGTVSNEEILLKSEGTGAHITLSNQNSSDRSIENQSIMISGEQLQVEEIPEEEPDNSFSSGEQRPISVDMFTESLISVVISVPSSSDVVDNSTSQSGSCLKSENSKPCTVVVSPASDGPDLSDQGGLLVKEVVI